MSAYTPMYSSPTQLSAINNPSKRMEVCVTPEGVVIAVKHMNDSFNFREMLREHGPYYYIRITYRADGKTRVTMDVFFMGNPQKLLPEPMQAGFDPDINLPVEVNNALKAIELIN